MAVQKRWAFLVGINEYLDYARLNYCVDDVLKLEELLTAAGYQVICLHDRQDFKIQGELNRRYPTVKNVRKAFKCLCSAISLRGKDAEEDLLLVYFACHGTSYENQPRLVVSDTEDPPSKDDAISITELEQGMNSSGAGRKVLMLDACHIGLANTGKRGPENSGLLRKIHDQAKGYALISASTDQQDAHEWKGFKHGVFSYYVLEGLSGRADLHNQGYVTVRDLFDHVSDNLQNWCAKSGAKQFPQTRTEGMGGFILVDDHQGLEQSIELERSDQDMQSLGNQRLDTQSRGRSPAELIEELWSLNCDAQWQVFDAEMPYTRRAAAFVVQAKDRQIQHWLVKRLAREIPNMAKARRFPFVVPAHLMSRQRSIEELWADLARQLKCQPEQAAVIDSLLQIYCNKEESSIIIAMYGWSRRSQALQQQVLNELWHPLVAAVSALERPALRSHIILFLAEGPTSETLSAAHSAECNPATPIRLAPLTEITSHHIGKWMVRDKVYSKLEQRMSSEEIEDLINTEIPDWERDPAAVIEQICYIFGLENGIADIEAEWRLTR